MKIKTQSWIIIGSVTIVPVIFVFIIAYFIYGQNQKLKSQVTDIVQQIYSCCERSDWSGFNFSEDIREFYKIISISASIDDQQVYSQTYDVKLSSERKSEKGRILKHGISTYVWTVPEVEEFLKDNLIDCAGYGKFNVVFTVTIPTDTVFKHLDTPKMIIMVGCIIVFGGIVLGVSLLIISVKRSVRSIEKVLKGWNENEFCIEVPKGCTEEIANLVRIFNQAGQKIHENYAMRDRFIMGLSHDFKTPLALIHGYSELLQKYVPAENEQAQKALNCIEGSTDQIEMMLTDLLDFIALDSREIPFYFEEVNLKKWMIAGISSVESNATLLGKEIKGDIKIDDDVVVKMDQRLMDRALVNIVQNALRYTDKGGKILVASEKKGNSVIISVSDNGPGIDKKDLPHVFELFYRASHERDKKGMGIGLAVVKSVVDGHGWNISVDNVKPHGACFTIEIPLI